VAPVGIGKTVKRVNSARTGHTLGKRQGRLLPAQSSAAPNLTCPSPGGGPVSPPPPNPGPARHASPVRRLQRRFHQAADVVARPACVRGPALLAGSTEPRVRCGGYTRTHGPVRARRTTHVRTFPAQSPGHSRRLFAALDARARGLPRGTVRTAPDLAPNRSLVSTFWTLVSGRPSGTRQFCFCGTEAASGGEMC
jgi:hypothetical protein